MNGKEVRFHEDVNEDGGPRILWFGDLSATGFGTVTMDIGRHLLAMGEDVRFISQNELENLPEPFASRTIDQRSLQVAQMSVGVGGHIESGGAINVSEVVPKLLTGQAQDYFTASGVAWGDWRPDVAVILSDFVGARLFMQPYLKEFGSLPTFHYVPIEGIDLPPLWGQLWRVARPVACSEFGASSIEAATGIRPVNVYHGIDTDVFRPATPDNPIVVRDERGEHVITSKERAKHFFGFDPKRKWVLRTDRNMPRKNYPAMLRALAPVILERPEVDVILHCREWDQGGYIPDTMSKFQQAYQDRVYLTGLGAVPREVLAIMYNAADVYVSAGAEGFGLTIAEAVACGTPAVGLDFSSVPEVIGPAGIVVPIDTLTDNEYDHFWARPNEAELGKAVAWLLDHKKRAREIGANGPRHVRDNFQWSNAARQFSTMLREATGTQVPVDGA